MIKYLTKCPKCGASVESRGGAVGPHVMPPFTTPGNTPTLCGNRWAR